MKMLWAAELSSAELNSLGDQWLVRAYREIGHPSLTTILTKSPSTQWLITLTPLSSALHSSLLSATHKDKSKFIALLKRGVQGFITAKYPL